MNKISIAHISHKYGDNFYAGKNREAVTKQVVNYCHEWWEDHVDDSTPPEDDQEVIDIYFNVENAGAIEGLEFQDDVEVFE